MNNSISISKNKKNTSELTNEKLKSLKETAEILSIPGAKKSIIEGLKQAKQEKGIPLSQLK